MITYFRAIRLLAAAAAVNGQRLSPLMNRFLGLLIWRSSGRARAASQNDGSRERVVDIFVPRMVFRSTWVEGGGVARRVRKGRCARATSGVFRFSSACFVFVFMGKDTISLHRNALLLFILRLGKAAMPLCTEKLTTCWDPFFLFFSLLGWEMQEYSLMKFYHIRGSWLVCPFSFLSLFIFISFLLFGWKTCLLMLLFIVSLYRLSFFNFLRTIFHKTFYC